MGNGHRRLGDRDAAIRDFQRAVELNPADEPLFELDPRLARVMRVLEVQGACLLARSGGIEDEFLQLIHRFRFTGVGGRTLRAA